MALPNPFENFTNMITDWFKDLQIYVDNLSPVPDGDNSMFPLIGIPYHFDTTVLISATVSQFTNYTDSAHGYGYQNIGFSHRLTLINGDLRCTNLQLQGKIATGNPGTWSKLTEAEQTDALEKAQQLLKVGVHNNYPDSKIGFSTYSLGSFGFTVIGHSTTDMHYKYEDKNGEHVNTLYTCSVTKTNNEITDNGDGTISGPFSDVTLGGRNFTKTTPTIVLFGNDTNAQDFVSRMQSTNRDVFNHVCVSGATYKVYVGETYLVYVIDNTKVYTFYDLYDGTKTATQKINDWTPGSPVIKVPTYEDVKYGPEPEPAGDEDIEVDMPLSDAAFGEGLSHYYVTTVGSSVLNDISSAMSTWDINNTGKDLYRNLLSCRITKVGPIPSESSTFVIYGEELQYNGSPITITKITGNPSMDLGEYEILPKFNDFRDYAPFTKIEMFIPYCGWVSLPSHCMSSEDEPKIITGTLLCDIIAGTCKAVIKCNDTVVAEASGFTAIDVPFTGENVGMKMAGIASSITSYGNQAAKTVGSVASGAMTGGAGAGAALAGGLVGMLGSYAQMYSAFNANYTEICGKTGDGCNVAGLGSVYIKIQRPKAGETESPYYVPANYAHTTGFMSMKQKKISECEGLIVCANVDTSGISGATARERAEIKRLLETGIYVNLPEPEPPEP